MTNVIRTGCGGSVVAETFESGVTLIAPLTTCCGASGKGSAGSRTGVVCRACYRDVEPAYGDCAVLGEEGDAVPLDRLAHWAADLYRCAVPEECAEHTLWLVRQSLPTTQEA